MRGYSIQSFQLYHLFFAVFLARFLMVSLKLVSAFFTLKKTVSIRCYVDVFFKITFRFDVDASLS